MTPTYWNEAKSTLKKRDKTLGKIISSYRGEAMALRGDGFFTLARSITGQQISVKAADSVWKKLIATVGCPLPNPPAVAKAMADTPPHSSAEALAKAEAGEGKTITPEIIANSDATLLRSCGLSERKVLYMHALANHFLENKKTIKNWPKMSDDEIIKELTSIHGIGRWTAEMFLIFGLGRPDIFPIDDLGLLKGIYRHYNAGEKLSRPQVLAIGERWQPYRTLGTWYMWRALDPLPVAY